MTNVMAPPIPDSYWVVPGRLLAGEYPGARLEREARVKLRRLLVAGVTFFLDLTEEDELAPYAGLVAEEAQARGSRAQHERRAIRDLGVPEPAEMAAILDLLDARLAAGEVVYVHCWGGIGRTGSVIGCYLARHGLTGRAALAEIARMRVGIPDAWRTSPETAEQRCLVTGWAAGA